MFHGLRDDVGVMAQDVGVVSHPEVNVFMIVDIPEPGPFCPFHEKRVGGEVVKVVAHAPGHDLPGPLEEFF
jgi:hypothetical protein